MSNETNKILKEIADRLKSIDERLGLLIVNPNLKETDPDVFYLDMVQSRFSQSEKAWQEEKHAMSDEDEFYLIAEEESNEIYRDIWGIEPLSEDIDPEQLIQSYTGLTFCDLANRLEDSLPANRSGRYVKLRKLFKSVERKMYSGSPYNQFLAAKTTPSKIRIDYHASYFITRIIKKLILKGELKYPKKN
jgi:hypothetical protein